MAYFIVKHLRNAVASLCGLRLAALIATVAAMWGAAGPARAQGYPTRPITIYSPAAAGSASDVQARVLARLLGGILKEAVNVVDMSGGSGAVAETQLEQRPADGYTLLFEPASQLAYTVANKMIPYKFTDFAAVAGVGGDAVSLVVRRDDHSFHSLPQFVAYARAHPGKLTIGGFGAVGQFKQTYSDLMHSAKITARYIPYNGGAKLVVALLGRQINAAVTAPSNVVNNHQLRVLAVATKTTFKPLPSMPTFVQSGYRVTQPVTRGFYARSETPGTVLPKLASAVAVALKAPQWQNFAKKEVIETKFMGPKAWQAYTASVLRQWQHSRVRGQ